MSNESLITIILVGIVAGWLAGQLVRGGGFGLVGDLLVGVVGAFIGSWRRSSMRPSAPSCFSSSCGSSAAAGAAGAAAGVADSAAASEAPVCRPAPARQCACNVWPRRSGLKRMTMAMATATAPPTRASA